MLFKKLMKPNWTRIFYKSALTGLYLSGAPWLAANGVAGKGVIFTLHQVGENNRGPFAPNDILKITPAFLEEIISLLKQKRYDIISMDEVPARLKQPEPAAPFAVFTFDDGYRDNRENALPLFEKHNIPLTIYIVADYASGRGELWWLVLEEIIRQNNEIRHPFHDGRIVSAQSAPEKNRIFEDLYWPLRRMDPFLQRDILQKFADAHEFDCEALTQSLIMNWQELKTLQAHPLVSLAAHTKHHHAIALLDEERAEAEISEGLERHQAELGEKPRHFAFPYGDPLSAGPRDFDMAKRLELTTAVTTRKGVLYKEHLQHLTALPRISLNGAYQSPHYVKAYLSGLPFYLANGMKKLNVS